MAETLKIASDLEEARRLEESILRQASEKGYTDSELFAIKLALEEGLTNAIRHGNRLDPDKTVEVSYEVTNEHIHIDIADQGPGFVPCDVPDPTADENIEKPCGRGIMLMRVYMDEVEYNERGNRVHLLKRKL